MPAITVVMPIYNTQQYLNQSIRSVLNQTFTDFELILINDGSTDYSLLYGKALAKRDSRIRLLDLPHGGVTAARIAGITAAQGDYVGFVDSDDRVEKDYLLHLIQAIRADDADISMCSIAHHYIDKTINFSFPDGSYQGSKLQELILSELFCRNDRSKCRFSYFLWDKLFKKTLLMENIKYLDNRLAQREDTLLFVACLLSSKSITVHEACDYHHYFRDGSTTHKFEMNIDEPLLFYHLMKEMLTQKGYAYLNYKVEAETLQIIARFIKNHTNVEIPPLSEELSMLIKTHSEDDGDDEWANDLEILKKYSIGPTVAAPCC